MQFSDPPRRAPEATLLPMINVVFLLLIFFMISARMTAPDPFPVTPPEAAAQEADEAQGHFTLHLGRDGQPGYRDAIGEAALPLLASARADHCARADCAQVAPRLTLRADAGLPAATLAGLVPRLSALGFTDLELLVRPGGGGP